MAETTQAPPRAEDDWHGSRFERAWSALIHPSSVLRPFLYASAVFAVLIAGYVIATEVRWTLVPMYVGQVNTKGGDEGARVCTLLGADQGESLSVLNFDHRNRLFVPKVSYDLKNLSGSVEIAQELAKDPRRPALGIVMDGLPLTDPDEEARAETGIRALARLYQSQLFVVIRKADAGAYKDLTDLEGRRVYLGKEGTAGRRIAEMLRSYYGLAFAEVAPGTDACDVVLGMDDESRTDRVDAAILLVNPIVKSTPWSGKDAKGRCNDDIIRYVAESGRYDLVPLGRPESVVKMLPFLDPVTIAAGAYPGGKGFPSREVKTFGVDTVLAATPGLSRGHGYQMAQWLAKNQIRLADSFGPATDVDSKAPQKSFHYTLHDGARDFYKDAPDSSIVPLLQFVTVLVSACIAYCVFQNTVAIKVRADRMIRSIDRLLTEHAEAPSVGRGALERLEATAAELYKEGKINKDGFDRVALCVKTARERLRAEAGATHGPRNESCSPTMSSSA